MSTEDIVKYAAEVLDERPADMAELAKLVAKELRKHASAIADSSCVLVARVEKTRTGHRATIAHYTMFASDFDNLTPSECANVIQAEEAKRTAEWAGDT